MNPYKETENKNAGRVADYVASTIKEGEEKIKNIASDMEKNIKQGEEQIKQFTSHVDKELHENPWPIVAGVAAISLLLGFILGQSKRGE